eukprot:6205010-Pleurochrysis_carterae.AAC.1
MHAAGVGMRSGVLAASKQGREWQQTGHGLIEPGSCTSELWLTLIWPCGSGNVQEIEGGQHLPLAQSDMTWLVQA